MSWKISTFYRRLSELEDSYRETDNISIGQLKFQEFITVVNYLVTCKCAVSFHLAICTTYEGLNAVPKYLDSYCLMCQNFGRQPNLLIEIVQFQ